MATKILIKSNNISGKIPRVDELSYAELAINTADGFLFTKKTNNTIVNLTSWQQLHDKPSVFPPSTHSHSPADIVGTAIINSDPRLTDARTPTAHTHGNITNGGRITATTLLSQPHDIIVGNTDGDLFKINKISPEKVGGVIETSGSVYSDIQNISSAITNLQNSSVLNTDPRLTDARTPLAHTHVVSDITDLSSVLSTKADLNHNHTLANNNVSVGLDNLSNISSGQDNTAIGAAALNSNTIGNNNIAVGKASMYLNTIGINNTAVGTFSLFSNLSEDNCAFGISALSSNTTGARNVCVGSASLPFTTTGINNTAVGLYAGTNNTTGSYNTVVGSEAGMSTSSLNNCIVLGANATAIVTGDFVVGSTAHPINVSTSVGSTGTADVLPGRPLGYLNIRLNGSLVKIPYYRV